MNEREQSFNKWVSKTRYTVEHAFGSISKWFGAGIAKYVGESKTHVHHLLEVMAYNLKRSPNLIIKLQIAQKQSFIVG